MKLYLMQGLPGTGKSSLARVIARDALAVVLSTDDFHHTDPANPHLYIFDPTLAVSRHEKNQERCRYFLSRGVSVVIDNTNITNAAIKPYVLMATALGIPVEIRRCIQEYGSVHGVPAEIIEKMRAAMEDLSVEKALASPDLSKL